MIERAAGGGDGRRGQTLRPLLSGGGARKLRRFSNRLGRTYYGHGSSIALVVFLALIALRVLSSQRRRRGRSGVPSPSSMSSYTDAPFPYQANDAASGATGGQITFTGIPPGWLVDPTGRHEKRYWSGTEWTEHVSDRGVPGTDPPPGGAGRESSS